MRAGARLVHMNAMHRQETAPRAPDELGDVLLRVARRADALAGAATNVRSDRSVWLRAELEVLEHEERARPGAWAVEAPAP